MPQVTSQQELGRDEGAAPHNHTLAGNTRDLLRSSSPTPCSTGSVRAVSHCCVLSGLSMSKNGASTTSGEPVPHVPHHKSAFCYIMYFPMSWFVSFHPFSGYPEEILALSSLLTPLSTYFTHREDPSAVSLLQAGESQLRTGEKMEQEQWR